VLTIDSSTRYKFTPLKLKVWENCIESYIVSPGSGEEGVIASMTPDTSCIFPHIVFEMCYEISLRSSSIEHTYVEPIEGETGYSLHNLEPTLLPTTPLFKLYNMWREVLALPVTTWKLQ
jgi:hypothetical protein